MTENKMDEMQDMDGPEPNYDIPAILMEYVNDILPDDEELDENIDMEDAEEEVSRAFFICVTAWNHAALPEDVGAIFLAQVADTFKDIDAIEDWDDVKEEVLEMSADMAEQYPGADHIIVDHELEALEDGETGLAIDIIPLEEAVAALRENA
jgi:hypothetical protein